MEIIYLQTPFRNDNQQIILASMLYWHKPIFFVSSFFRVWTWIWMVTETRDLLPRWHSEGNLRWDTDESMACTAVCRQVVGKKSKSAYDIPEKKFSVQSSLTSQFQGKKSKKSGGIAGLINLLIYLTYQNSLITEYPDYLLRLSSALSSFFPKTFLGTCVSLYSCFTLRTF